MPVGLQVLLSRRQLERQIWKLGRETGCWSHPWSEVGTEAMQAEVIPKEVASSAESGGQD